MKRSLTPRLFVTILLATLALPLFAWQISKSTHSPRPGDNYKVMEVISPDYVKSGRDIVWNFQNLEIKNTNTNVSYRGTNGGYITYRRNRNQIYLLEKDDTIFWCGNSNRMVNIKDSVAAIHMIFPFEYGDSITMPFSFLGKYASEQNTYINGVGHVLADATGTLILPEGDTITDVIRVCRTYRANADINYHKKPIPTMLTDSMTVLEYRQFDWYAQGYRYPLFSVNEAVERTPDEEEMTEREAYYCAPASLAFDVRNDPENEKIREHLRTDKTENRQPRNPMENGFPLENITITPEGYMVSIGFENNSNISEIELIVSDSSGIAYIRIPKRIDNGGNHITVDCGRLPAGEYAMLLVAGMQRKSVVFTLR